MILDCRLQNSDFYTGTLPRSARQYCANPNSEILNHPSPFPLPHSQFLLPPSRSPLGVTLIELLITISIVATLGAFFLGVSTAAMESSRAARTRTLIGKIHNLLMEHMETYATRRVDVNSAITATINSQITDNRIRGQMHLDIRLLALRELMTLEMPGRWSDVLQESIGGTGRSNPQMLETYPSLCKTYRRRYLNLKADYTTSEGQDKIAENQSAECLYMIIMLATADGEARTLFSEQDIGDTDGDGAPEFLDGWGRPIRFIRWPAGFILRSDLMTGDADLDPDPLDIYKRDQPNALRPLTTVYPDDTDHTLIPASLPILIDELRDDYPAFRLLPLVYSVGPDGEADIDDEPYTGTAPVTSLNPYAIDPDNNNEYVYGLPADMNEDGVDNSLDNIHNHLLD